MGAGEGKNLTFSGEAFCGAACREMVREHSPPPVGGIHCGWASAPEERSGDCRAAGEEQVVDIVAVEIRGANRIFGAIPGPRATGAVKHGFVPQRSRGPVQAASFCSHWFHRQFAVPGTDYLGGFFYLGVEGRFVQFHPLACRVGKHTPTPGDRTEMDVPAEDAPCS